jgi:hypothetical protein
MVIFRKDIGEIILGLFNKKDSESRNFAVKVVLSMIPAVVIGLFFEEALESLFSGHSSGDQYTNGRFVKISHFKMGHMVKELHPYISDHRLSQPIGKIIKSELAGYLPNEDG